MSMSAAQARRQAVAQALEEAVGPVSAAALAERFSVSRQIIVGDVALLRAGGTDILATPRGYLLGGRGGGVERTVACVHAPEEMERELNAIVDAGGNLKAFCRMDGAFLGSIDVSMGKAKTARLFNMSTADLGAASQPGQELYGIEVTNGGLVIFGGGELLKNKDGVIIGAIGVSGGSVAEDTNVAKAGVAALNK